jgi:hypothetical protein
VQRCSEDNRSERATAHTVVLEATQSRTSTSTIAMVTFGRRTAGKFVNRMTFKLFNTNFNDCHRILRTE